MNRVPGFGAAASLHARMMPARETRRNRNNAHGTVVPAGSCAAGCFIKLVDCVLASESNCNPRYQLCKFWCRYGPAS